ncbi:unnamed protein product, partial [Timema podura]|nr:unnamed protein product [Timema podura]
IGKAEYRGTEPAFARRKSGKPPPFPPIEIQTSICTSSAVWLNTKLAHFAEGPSEENSSLYPSQIIEHEGTSDGDSTPHVSSNARLTEPAMGIEDLTPHQRLCNSFASTSTIYFASSKNI